MKDTIRDLNVDVGKGYDMKQYVWSFVETLTDPYGKGKASALDLLYNSVVELEICDSTVL